MKIPNLNFVVSGNRNKAKINRKKLLKLYMGEVSKIADECDWKTEFGPEEIVGIICSILEKNPELLGRNGYNRG